MFKLKNWKTTVSGISAIITGLVSIVVQKNIVEGVSAIVAGVGLISAKDHNVTGGDVQQ